MELPGKLNAKYSFKEVLEDFQILPNRSLVFAFKAKTKVSESFPGAPSIEFITGNLCRWYYVPYFVKKELKISDFPLPEFQAFVYEELYYLEVENFQKANEIIADLGGMAF